MQKEKFTDNNVKNGEELITEIKKKQVRPHSSENRKPQTEAGDNTKYLQHTLYISNLGKIDMKKPEEVRERINAYFAICSENDMKPSVAGLALALSMTRQNLWLYASGKFPIPKETAEEIERAYSIINAQMEDFMQNGKINPVSGIFLMKNNMGYHDQQEYILTPNTQQETDPTELIAEANELPND